MDTFFNIVQVFSDFFLELSLFQFIIGMFLLTILFLYFKYINKPFLIYIENLINDISFTRTKLIKKIKIYIFSAFSIAGIYLFALYIHPLIIEKLENIDIEEKIISTFDEINNDETLNLTFYQILEKSSNYSEFEDYIPSSLRGKIFKDTDQIDFSSYSKKSNTENDQIDFNKHSRKVNFKDKQNIYSLNENIELEKIIKAIQMNFPQANKNYIEAIYWNSKRLNIDPFFSLGMVAQESSFRVNVKSEDNAYGLFQVLPSTADEVIKKVFKKKNIVLTIKDLKEPYTNIELGTGYISLLRDHHFRYVKDEKVRFILMVHSYFGGIGNILKIFYNKDMSYSKNMKIAQENINKYDLKTFEKILLKGLYKKKSFKTLAYPKLIHKHRSAFIKNYKNI